MTIYTRRGDSGETGLADGSRVSKASAQIEALGALDEVGAAIGFARQAVEDPAIAATLLFAQQRLFNCGAIVASEYTAAGPGAPAVTAADVAALEAAIDRFEGTAQWRGFTLASGGEAATRLHLARTVARRAERRLVALAATAHVLPEILAFVNRLSDLLFAAAQATAAAAGIPQDRWDPLATPGAEGQPE
jgi:cob(I)alamin adenosyltransferase